MTRTRTIILVMGVLLFSLSTQIASGQDIPNYFSVNLGVYSPQSDDLEDFDEGFSGELTFGHYYNENFATEISIGYFETDATFSGFDPLVGFFNESDEISVIPVIVTGKGIIPASSNFEIYGEAGVGAYFISGEADISTSSLGNFSIDDDTVEFGFHLGIGADVNITPNVFFGIEGRYIFVEADFEAFGLTLEADLEGFIASGQLGYRF